ncbi:type IV pilin protein [Nitrincola sp. MINF-07-Sa-05]|uniref:type IV pilin protein n=1 Tax=Nitrincola salilacus TaxID=3400273 RepID=UPI003917C79B
MKRAKGFTLIEVMIAVVILAIVAAVAFPSYQQYLVRSNRAEAQSFLMDLAQRQQQFIIDARSYASTVAALGATVPENVDRHYTIAIVSAVATPPTFTITATPRSGGMQASDGNLTINQAGVKSW